VERFYTALNRFDAYLLLHRCGRSVWPHTSSTSTRRASSATCHPKWRSRRSGWSTRDRPRVLR